MKILIAILASYLLCCNTQFHGESLRFKLAALNLPNRDLDFEGVSDPYALLWTSSQQDGEARHWQQFGQTAAVKDSLNPIWDEVFVYQYINGTNQTWRIFVNDKDQTWYNPLDEPLGRVDVQVEDYLYEIKRNRENGSVKPVQLFLTRPIGGALIVTPITD